MESKKTQVEIGDRLIEVGRFSTFKAIHAGELVSEVLNEVPGLSEKMADFGVEFRSKNTLRLSRAAVEMRYPPEEVAKITEAAWESGNGYYELPASPGALDVAAFVLPVAFKASKDRVLELLALVVIPNSELREADEAGGVKDRLDREKKFLLHSDLGEMVDLLVAAAEVIGEQFEGKAGAIRGMLAKLGFEIAPEEEPIEGEATGMPESSTSKPTTSTDSEPSTDGPEPSPSTEPSSTSPVGSSTA